MSHGGQESCSEDTGAQSSHHGYGNNRYDRSFADEGYYDALPEPGPHRTHKPQKSSFVRKEKLMHNDLASIFGTAAMEGAVTAQYRSPLSVRFTPDTAPGIEADVAVSITRHRIKDNKYIEYTVVVHQKGYAVHALTKRYKQFEALNSSLKDANKLLYIPPMPTKRYFKTNKWDEEYHMERRFSLQQYLRVVIKLFAKSPELREFLELKDDIIRHTDQCVFSDQRLAGLPPEPTLQQQGGQGGHGGQDGQGEHAGTRVASIERPPLKVSYDGTILSGGSGKGTSSSNASATSTITTNLGSTVQVAGCIEDPSINSVGSSDASRPPLKVSADMVNAAKKLSSSGRSSFNKNDNTANSSAATSSTSSSNSSELSPSGKKIIHAHATLKTHSTSSSSAIPVQGVREVSVDYDVEVLEAMTARLKQIALEDSLEKGSGMPINSRLMGVSASPRIAIDYIDRVDGLSSSPAVRSSFGTSPHSFSRMKNKEMMMLSQMNELIGDEDAPQLPVLLRDSSASGGSGGWCSTASSAGGAGRPSDDMADFRFHSAVSNGSMTRYNDNDSSDAVTTPLDKNTAANAVTAAATGASEYDVVAPTMTRQDIITSSNAKNETNPKISPLTQPSAHGADGISSSDYDTDRYDSDKERA